MKRKSFILSLAMVFCLAVCVCSASAADYDLTLVPTTDGNTPSDTFLPGSDLYLNIDLVAPETGKVAGVAFTLTYPSDKLDAPATNTEGLPTVASDITSTLLMMMINSNNEKTHRVNSATAGSILFSGAAINTTGGAGFHYQDATLFTVKFKVKDTATGDITFGLKQTTLTNPDAGWNGEGVPVLVGAIPNTDPNYGGTDLSDDFPVLLQNFAANPTETVSAGTDEWMTWLTANYPDIVASGRDTSKTADWDHDGVTNEMEKTKASKLNDKNDPIGDVSGVDVTDPNTWPADYDAKSDFRVSNMDIDGNGTPGLTTDALLLIRHMAGPAVFDDAALIDGAVGVGCTRCTAAKIRAYIDTIKATVYDVDGSGVPALTTDALLIIRHIAGPAVFNDAALIDGAIDTVNATRRTASEIRAYIDMLFPGK
jgi:hypothetical protein